MRELKHLPGSASDGYHTFDELYEHRHALWLTVMALCPMLAWMSRYHEDGSGYDGWFLTGMDLPSGTVTYHLPERLWEAAQATGARVLDRGKPWDGHTSLDVIQRLMEWSP